MKTNSHSLTTLFYHSVHLFEAHRSEWVNEFYGMTRMGVAPKEVIIFYLTGGCGRNGMKDSVKFLIPPGSSRKIVDPPSLFVKISCDPPLKLPPPKVCWVFNDVVLTCKGHCPCQLGVWECCKVPRAEP